MKKTLFTLILVFSATILFAKQEEYKREINKEFTVSANAYLTIANIYGNVNIIEGNEGKIVFKIEITGTGKNEATAKEYAEGVDINFTASGNNVSAKTKIPNMKCNNCGITVNYVVIVPASTTMDFDLKYGDLSLGNTPKPLNVTSMYGNVKANTISDATIDIKYGDVKLDKCGNLKVKSMYGDFKSGIIKDAVVNTHYGKFEFDEGQDIKIISLYSDVKGNTMNDLTLNIQYANTTIGKCDNMSINSLYGDIKVTTAKDASIKIQYAKAEIGKCNDLSLQSMYVSYKIGNVTSIKAQSQYDKFKINTIDIFSITAIYTDIIIDNLNKSFVADKFQYCDLSIANISTDFSKIESTGMYSELKLGLTEKHNFKAALSAEYGTIKTGNIVFNNVTPSAKEKTIKGTAGKQSNPAAEVNISAKYGNIIFTNK
ncbi:MAG: DUF4097 domain-containing protein [Prevotellaceae bacterium]|jgi:hypothetical protein|nr:DUF4097 domain-containing protein [Prevotellaceae bacterium]